MSDDATEHHDDEPAAPIVITNEFAEVAVRPVRTGQGVRLELHSPRLGRRVQLDALQLESITWQQPDAFSTFLADPFGP